MYRKYYFYRRKKSKTFFVIQRYTLLIYALYNDFSIKLVKKCFQADF